MKATLREQLIRIEQQFLLAIVSNDEEPLRVFFQEWSQLAHDIESLKVDGRFDQDTALLLSRVSRVVASMTRCMLECGSIFQEAQSYSISHFIFDAPTDGQSSISDLPQEIPPCRLLFSSPLSALTPSILGQQRLLDFHAYRWLRQNIHNPYPSPVQMQIIGDVAGTSVAQVKLWFEEVRDSIGWTKLSCEFFAGSMDPTVAAAQRIYLEGDTNDSFDVIFAFTSVKAYAETLFSEHPALQAEHIYEDVAQTSRSMDIGLNDSSKGNIYIPSASNPSIPSYASPSWPIDEDEFWDTTPPPSVVGRKRRLPEDTYMSQGSVLQIPKKRLRTSSASELTLHNAVSPNSSTMGTRPLEPITTPSLDQTPTSRLTVSACPSYPIHPVPPLSPPASVSRKRDRGNSESPSERVTDSPRATRRQRLSDTVPPSSPEQLWHIRVTQESISADKFLKSPNDASPANSIFDSSTLQATIDSCPPFDLVNVHDWSKMPIPQGETAPQMPQVTSIYVPGSDLPSLDPTLPEKIEAAQCTSSWWASDPEDLSFLLQFPESTYSGQSFPPSLYSEAPLSLQDNGSRNVWAFSDQFQPDSLQSPSSLSPSSSTSSPAPSTPDDSTLLPTVSPFHGTDTDAFIWDSSTPPSDILPGLFQDNVLTPDWGFLATLQSPLC
ncbi:hypothetical protein BGW80DRAFT_1265253 [Lactifluus volemus]|nr:hypothetical protein BGW80DRAFT_1265253 [Lactifluus volemus]